LSNELSPDDERALLTLRRAIEAADDVPENVVAHAIALYTWRTVDAELMALTFDSLNEPVDAGVRGESVVLRSLSFEGPTVMLEVEVRPDGLIGQVVPPQAGTVDVETPTGKVATVQADDLGAFHIRPYPRGQFRLTCRLADNLRVVTDWFSV
jgi:hypothetical protein